MGWLDSLFGKKSQSPDDLPPTYGGSGKSATDAVVINCASMSMANELIDRFISERHGEKGRGWIRGIELSIKHPESPAGSLKAIAVSLPGNQEEMYYFDLSRPSGVARKMQDMGSLAGRGGTAESKISSLVIAHTYDAKRGYSKQELSVGDQIDPSLVERLGDNGNIYALVTYEAGKPVKTVVKKEIWNKVMREFEGQSSGARGVESAQPSPREAIEKESQVDEVVPGIRFPLKTHKDLDNAVVVIRQIYIDHAGILPHKADLAVAELFPLLEKLLVNFEADILIPSSAGLNGPQLQVVMQKHDESVRVLEERIGKKMGIAVMTIAGMVGHKYRE